jgi:putative solute:sodium symporter small subunit
MTRLDVSQRATETSDMDGKNHRDQAEDVRQEHWRRTRRLTLQLMLVWLAVTFGIIFFARELSGLVLFGWPLSFYLAAQGAVLAYTILIAIHAWKMHALDRRPVRESGHGE